MPRVGRQYTDIKEAHSADAAALAERRRHSQDKGLTTPHSVGATGSQTLFNGEQTANKVRAAESQVSAARETLRMMEQSVLLAAATVYMDMSRDSANLEVQQNNVRVLQRTLTDTNNRFTAGQVTDDRRRAIGGAIGGRPSDACMPPKSALMTTRANYRRIIGVEPAESGAGLVGRSARAVDAQCRGRGRHRAEPVGHRGAVRRRRRATAGQDRGRRAVADADRAIQRPAATISPDHDAANSSPIR